MTRTPTYRERLLSKVVPQPSGHWLWTGRPNSSGYGRIAVGGRGTGAVMAHRAVYEEFVGPIPEGMVIDHLCLVKLCVNPLHLEAVTPGENTRRNLNCPSTQNRLRNRCPRGHEYTKVFGQRRCVPCAREGERRRRRESTA